MHGIDWRVYACAAILQIEKAKQQEKEDQRATPEEGGVGIWALVLFRKISVIK
jgi:hypothetical protein